MFEDSHTWSRFGGESQKALGVHLGHVPYLEPDDGSGKKRMRLAVALAVAFHVAFFLIYIPADSKPLEIGRKPSKVFVVKQVRFKAPPPKAAQQIPKRREKKRVIPIPDPTPEEPEPILVEEVEFPDADVLIGDVVFGIPDGPPDSYGLGGDSPMQIGSGVAPPIKTYGPTPRYTEEGRQARITGVVILNTVVDREGNVTFAEVLKGLPMGLSESALATVKEWKYKPATLEGKPVAVFVNVTIRFSLQ
jgi:TonB family protein